MGNEKTVVSLMVVLLLVNVIAGGYLLFKPDKEIQVPAPVISDNDKQQIAQLVLTNLPKPEVVEVPKIVEVYSNGSSATGSQSVTVIDKESVQEDKALEIATSEVSSKDFKKAILEVLNANNQSVESYKDIESVTIRDSDVSVSGRDGEVEFEVLVKYFNDGDSDLEDQLRAKLDVSLEVVDLNDREDFVDAELVEYDDSNFELIKLYD